MALMRDDPVFVVDLTPEVMEASRGDFESDGGAIDEPGRSSPETLQEARGDALVRSIALVFSWQRDPVLLAVSPTRDLEMLDALARLIRATLITGHSLSTLVTDYGDEAMKRMYFAKRFPRFVYQGIPATVRSRLPERLVAAMGSSRR